MPLQHGKTDADAIQEAYGDALNNLFKMLVGNIAGVVSDVQAKFKAGLADARTARDLALAAADSYQLTIAFKTDAELIRDAYGDRIKGLFPVLITDIDLHKPNPQVEFAGSRTLIRNARDQALSWI